MSLLHPHARLSDVPTGDTPGGPGVPGRGDRAAAAYGGHVPGVAFVRIPVTPGGVVRYLGAWQAGRPLALLDPDLAADTLADLVDRYEPAVVTDLDTGAVPQTPPAGYDRV